MINYNEAASSYSEHRETHPEVLANLITTGDIEKNSKVLEVGCGNGNYIIALNQATGCTSYGIDPSRKMLSKAKGRGKEVIFLEGEGENLDFEEDFDLIFSVDVIHYLDNPPQYFEKAYESLTEGGKICTVTDSEWIIRNRKPLSNYFPESIKTELKRYPKVDELKKYMTNAGFTEIDDKVVEYSKQITDLQPYSEKAFSALHLISDEAYKRGIKRMEEDLKEGPIQRISRYILLWGSKIDGVKRNLIKKREQQQDDKGG